MELTAKSRAEYPPSDLTIAGISAAGSSTVSIEMLKSGANDFIARPFRHEEFYCRINQNNGTGSFAPYDAEESR